MKQQVPFVDLKTMHRELADEILGVWRDLLENASFVGGAELQEFEREFAAFIGTEHCVGVSSGTAALRLALQAVGVGHGDEVVTVAHTFIATGEAITQVGAVPVLVDVHRGCATMHAGHFEAAITPRTRAVVPVHMYGQTADMQPILDIARRYGLAVVEDAAQAHGARYHGARAGSLGDAAAFSFYPGKNLGACGDGGAVTTNDSALARKVTILRNHGQTKKYHHEVEGWNARLHTVQAAALRIKLRHLERWTVQRREAAAAYARQLEGTELELPPEMPGREHVYHLYVVRHHDRDRIQSTLDEQGVTSGLHYPAPLHLLQAYARLGHSKGDFPESERWASYGLSLPLYPGLTDELIRYVASVIRSMNLEPARRATGVGS